MKLISLAVIIIAFSVPFNVLAQNTLLGKVVTESDNIEKPVGYASISTSESNKAILADSKGNLEPNLVIFYTVIKIITNGQKILTTAST